MVKKSSMSNSKAKEPADITTEEKKSEIRPHSAAKGDDNKNEEEEDDDSKFKGRIDVHTLNYFKRVEKFLEEDSFEDDESRELFLNNVMAQVGEGLQTCQLAKHWLTSKVLEELLAMCSTSQVIKTFKSLLVDILTVSDDRFGSHVVQKTITLIPKHLDNKDLHDGLSVEIESAVLEFYKVIKENISELLRSVYCCHIISSFIQVLAGINVTEAVSRSRNSRETRTKFFGKKSAGKKPENRSFGVLLNKTPMKVPESFHKTLRKLSKKILEDDNFGELLCHRNASPVIQTLLLGLKDNDPKLCYKLCSLIISKSRILEWKASGENETGEYNKSVPILFADEVGSHIMEKIFYVMSADMYKELFTKCFSKNLLVICLHPLANYILQHMLATVPNASMAEQILQELIPFTEDILACGNMGVIVRMAELSLRFNCMQKEFTMALGKSVHLPDTKEEKNVFLKLLLTLSTYEVFYGKDKEDAKENENDDDAAKEFGNEEKSGKLTKEALNYHGACLVKNLLHFEKPKIFVQCFLKMEDEIILLANHEYGSFVLEAFFTSQSISKMKKQSCIRKIQKNFISLATNKFGSHVIDKIWSQSDSEGKQEMKDELSKHKSMLRGNMYGRIILRNCGIETFQRQNSLNKQVIAKTEVKMENSVSNESMEKTKEADHDAKTKKQKLKRKRKVDVSEGTSYMKEFKTLGTGVADNDEVSIDKDDNDSQVATTNSSKDEIDELFDAVAKKPKTKRKTKKAIS